MSSELASWLVPVPTNFESSAMALVPFIVRGTADTPLYTREWHPSVGNETGATDCTVEGVPCIPADAGLKLPVDSVDHDP